MSDLIKWILVIALVWIVGGIVVHLLAGLIHIAITIAIIALFCYLVYAVVRAATRQKL